MNIEKLDALINFARRFGLRLQSFENPSSELHEEFKGAVYAVKPDADIYHDGSSAFYDFVVDRLMVTIHSDDDGVVKTHEGFDFQVEVDAEEMRRIIETGIGPGGREMIDSIESWSGGKVRS